MPPQRPEAPRPRASASQKEFTHSLVPSFTQQTLRASALPDTGADPAASNGVGRRDRALNPTSQDCRPWGSESLQQVPTPCRLWGPPSLGETEPGERDGLLSPLPALTIRCPACLHEPCSRPRTLSERLLCTGLSAGCLGLLPSGGPIPAKEPSRRSSRKLQEVTWGWRGLPPSRGLPGHLHREGGC